MFRIKPTRNQTTAKHANLSPYPNNQLPLNPKVQSKLPIKATVNQKDNKIAPKLGVIDSNKDKGLNYKGINYTNDTPNKIARNNQLIVNNQTKTHIQVNNPQKAAKQSINPTKNVLLLSKNTNAPTNKQNERVLLKRTENQKEHKLKIETVKKNEIPPIISTNNKAITTLKKQPLGSLVKRKQSALGKRVQKIEAKKQNHKNQNSQKQLGSKKLIEEKEKLAEVKIEVKPIINQKKQHVNPQVKVQVKPEYKAQIIEQKVQKTQLNNHSFSQVKPKPSQLLNYSQKNQQIHQQPNKNGEQKDQQKNEQKNQKEKQMEQLMLKIQKRREARQQEKKRLKQIQQKRKQNQQRALQFLNSRNQPSNVSQNQGVAGMLKLNDQLMHFSLAQTIMDLQIKKLLKTNFDQFPNKTQIQYQIEQLQRINLSYEMIRDDQNNPLRNGLQNYRVQIFNKIGDLIMQAQEGGYSNPNFHILEHDGRLNQGPNSLIPQAVRGLPEETLSKFIRFEQNNEEDECTICLGDIKFKEICAYVECGHKFHSSCIKEWVKSSANCPTCRFNVKFGRKDK